MTWVWYANPSRQARRRRDTMEVVLSAGRPKEGDEYSGEEDDDGCRDCLGSTKRLALSLLIGFGCAYDILHFAFDLKLWTTLGAKKNLGLDVKMRVMMKSQTFIPLYWKRAHLALMDLVRQRGYLVMYYTISPYERSMPYHVWLLDEMSKTFRARMRHALGETLLMTHVLTQTAQGALAGVNQRSQRGDRRWTRHLLSCPAKDADTEASVDDDIMLFDRIEFQDGTRKDSTQDYHGSGRPHMHLLAWADKPEELHLEEKVSATVPTDEPDLRGYVMLFQVDKNKTTPWRVQQEASHWCPRSGTYRLHHTPDDNAIGLRAYILDFMDVRKCHEDFQMAQNDAVLRAYVAKYVPKMSDSFTDDLLNDAAGAHNIAASVLARYRPYEPEMVLQLFGARFRQWHVTTRSRGTRDFVAPWPDKNPMPQEVRQYEACGWKGPRATLFDFLRKTAAEGKISAWLVAKHAVADTTASLQDFVRDYVMRGEKTVAAEFLSRLSEKYYGQWLMMHVPFRRASDFLDSTRHRNRHCRFSVRVTMLCTTMCSRLMIVHSLRAHISMQCISHASSIPYLLCRLHFSKIALPSHFNTYARVTQYIA